MVDTNIAAIMMDSSPLLEQDVNGLCNAIMRGKKDHRRKGAEESRWSHDVLVKKTREMQDWRHQAIFPLCSFPQA